MPARKYDLPDSLRLAFTLVELLVVMAIMAVLAGIGVYAFTPFSSKSAVNNGGVMLQSWITAAKQLALRDQQPRGLRLLPGDEILDDTGAPISWLVTKCVFIEQQDDITGTVDSSNPTGFKTTAAVPTLAVTDYAYAEINGGLLYQIKSASGIQVTLFKPLPFSIPANSVSFRIHRSPKTVTNTVDTAGTATEDILRMPNGSGIHLKANADFAAKGNALTPAMPPGLPPLDIMFSPNGSVMFPSANYDKIVLWVTGTNRNATGVISPLQGQPNLVVVNSRTGYIAGYSVDIGSGNPYSQFP